MSRTAIAAVVCLLLAGCAAPTAPTDSPTTGADGLATTATSVEAGATPDEATTVETPIDADDSTTNESNRSALDDQSIAVSGTMPVNHDRVFARTTRLLGVNVTPPSIIVVQSPAEIQSDYGGVSRTDDSSGRRNFVAVMGIGRDDGRQGAEGDDDGTDGEGVAVAAYTPSPHSVFVNERLTTNGRESVLERTLAHEFVHTVQFRQNAFERLQRALDLRQRYSRDRYLAYLGVVEGTAVFVADAYDRRYLAGNWATITTTEQYRSASSGAKYSIARYYFGGRYLAHRFDAPANVSTVYDDPPRTTEQLLHNDTNRSEAPERLSLFVHPGENRTSGQADTNGELFTRIALGTELNETQAAGAAAGWGADRLVTVAPENRTRNRSFVWATRWDSPAEADEFGAALEAYLDARASYDERAGVWRDNQLAFRTVRVSDETVVLLAGEAPFVGNATVSGANASVSVSSNE